MVAISYVNDAELLMPILSFSVYKKRARAEPRLKPNEPEPSRDSSQMSPSRDEIIEPK